MIDLKLIEASAKALSNENAKVIKKLKSKRDQDVDRIIHDAHYETFERIDCLDCGNCCKTTGPLITDKDIQRISKHLKLKPQGFIEKYIRVDEDQDYVFKTMPCVFLGEDNYCSIYDVRPKACKEFPHTDRVKQKQLLNLTLKNTEVCPAVFEMVETIKKGLK